MDFKDLFVVTDLGNTDKYGSDFDYTFDTHDYFYVDSQHEALMRLFYGQDGDKANLTFPTDYAILNKAIHFADKADLHAKLAANHTDKRSSCATWLRTGGQDNFDDKHYCVNIINEHGHIGSVDMREEVAPQSVRPCVQLDVDACMTVLKHLTKQKQQAPYFQINQCKMSLGLYPKTYVGDDLNAKFEARKEDEDLTLTGKSYTGRYNKKRQKLTVYDEYEIDGEKYIRVDKGFKGNDGYWVKIEPIDWTIDNWDDLPKAINPQGTGEAETVQLRAEAAIIAGIPFYPNNEDEHNHLWQNSSLRGYLNGYNVNYIQYNGAQVYSAPRGGNFTQQNFLKEAMIDVKELIRDVRFYGKKKFVPTVEANPNALKNNQLKEKNETLK